MRHTEFWARMEHALGSSYARTWSREHVIAELGGRTVEQALDAGESPKRGGIFIYPFDLVSFLIRRECCARIPRSNTARRPSIRSFS